MDGRTDKQLVGWLVGWLEGWRDGQTDGHRVEGPTACRLSLNQSACRGYTSDERKLCLESGMSELVI